MKAKNTTFQLLSPNLLFTQKGIASEIDLLRRSMLKEIGWHYWVDLTWILSKLDESGIRPGATILDAGAGKGLLQFLLSKRGYNIISVDFYKRTLPWLHKFMFPIIDEQTKSQLFFNDYIEYTIQEKKIINQRKLIITRIRRLIVNIFLVLRLLISRVFRNNRPGKITLIQADIRDMPFLASNSIDAIVSCSVIEHLEFSQIAVAIDELSRILKSEGSMLITTSASQGKSWFHEPSKGWCISKQDLEFLTGIPSNKTSDNFYEFDRIMKEYINSEELKSILAPSYFASKNNGMPWGKWQPAYVPVGININKA